MRASITALVVSGPLFRADTRPNIDQITPNGVDPRWRVKKRLSVLVKTRIEYDKVSQPRVAVLHVM